MGKLKLKQVLWLTVFLVAKAELSTYKAYQSSITHQRRYLPLVLTAESGEYDQEQGQFIAKGCVRLQQEGTVVYADTLIYDEKKDEAIARGHVRLEDAAGDVLFCHEAILSGGLKEGVLTHVQMMTHARERVTATRIMRRAIKENKVQELEMGSYTPCEKCQDTLKPPVWSLHARHIHNDEDRHQIHYTDAHLEFLGVPVLYIPYFHMATKRSSGFLVPDMSSSKELGLYTGVPYYWAIDSSKDFLVKPFLTEKGGAMLAQQYRQRFNRGMVKLSGAFNSMYGRQYLTGPDGKTDYISPWRGYFHEEGAYDINAHWRFRSDEWWVSDKTFLSTRPFFGKTTAPYLESTTGLEGFYQYHFVQARGLRYQGLQEKDSVLTTPIIYPELHYFYHSPPLWNDSILDIHMNTLSLYRSLGNQMQRMLLDGQWALPWITSWGQEISVFASIYGGLYLSRLQEEERGSSSIQYKTGRFFPQGGAEIRWPFSLYRGMITPMLQIVASPTHVNTFKIPNEDSQAMAFDDTNLFTKNRYAGFDRLDEGSRANYGIEWSFPQVRVFLGQSYAFTDPASDLWLVGVQKGGSNVVGRAMIDLPHANVFYRFRCDHRSLSMRLQEVGWMIGPSLLSLEGSYVFSQQKPHRSPFSIYNQLFASLSSHFASYWETKIFMRQDFKTPASRQRLLDKGIELSYQDECFAAGISVQHSYYRMRDLRPGYSVDFYISLKNLGGLRKQKTRFSQQLN